MNGHKGFLTPRRLLVVALAILSVGIIVTVRYINASGTHAGYEYERGRDDTINVAIAYSPLLFVYLVDIQNAANIVELLPTPNLLLQLDNVPRSYPWIFLDESRAKVLPAKLNQWAAFLFAVSKG